MATAFWIASERKFVHEAQRSARSLKRHMPDVKRVLFEVADVPSANEVFDEIQTLPERQHDWWYLDSARYFGWAIDALDDQKCLYLDTDTYICSAIYDILELLGRFDLIGCHAPGRGTSCNRHELPQAFPEFNIGMLGLLNTPRLRRMLDDWYKRFAADPKRYCNNDQGALREALLESNLQLYVAPPEYNCRFGFGGFARWRVKVLHGRPDGGEYERIDKLLNEEGKIIMRAWKRGEVQ